MDYYLREVDAATRNGDLVLLGAALEGVGDFYRNANEKQKAIEHYERARMAYQQSGQRSNEIGVMRSMGYLYRDLRNTAKAEELLKLADEMTRAPRAPR